ncbi:MAG: hypothetical protein M1812_004317 [Candelaria pacifica]|nr:MAG: hypothetical protein M1812_004317 [Candelaria pacifica]
MSRSQNLSPAGNIDPSVAQAAQIPLQDFVLPDFPPSTSDLKALTLTSDIKLDEYTAKLSSPAPLIPANLPKSIESLTLELFSLGYPSPFLANLSAALPHLSSLVVYSQLLAGISDDSCKDAETFFKSSGNLRALHLLDVFARPGFFANVGKTLSSRPAIQGLRFLEVNYSFRHEDEEFLTRVPSIELPALIGRDLVTCALNISPPDVTNDPDDPANLTKEGEATKRRPEGVMTLNQTLAQGLVNALCERETAPRELMLLNTSLYTLSVEQLKTVLGEHRKLLVLVVSIRLEPTEEAKKAVLNALALCKNLEQVEIVGNPSLAFFTAMSNPDEAPSTLLKAFPSAEDMKSLGAKCPKLTSFKASILRTISLGSVEWTKNGTSEEWQGGVTKPDIAPLQEDARDTAKDK